MMTNDETHREVQFCLAQAAFLGPHLQPAQAEAALRKLRQAHDVLARRAGPEVAAAAWSGLREVARQGAWTLEAGPANGRGWRKVLVRHETGSPRFHVPHNGRRFAKCSELERMRRRAPALVSWAHEALCSAAEE